MKSKVRSGSNCPHALDGTSAPLSLAGAEAAIARQARDHVLVRTRGVFAHGEERYLFATRHGEPGWRVITPLITDPGDRLVLVDRGFVPSSLRIPSARPGGQPWGSVTVQGLLRPLRAKGMFTPANEPSGNIWYWPDIPALLASLDLAARRSASPNLLIALPDETITGAMWPSPEPPSFALIPNNHRGYAATWFALAAALAAIALLFLRSRAGRGPPP